MRKPPGEPCSDRLLVCGICIAVKQAHGDRSHLGGCEPIGEFKYLRALRLSFNRTIGPHALHDAEP